MVWRAFKGAIWILMMMLLIPLFPFLWAFTSWYLTCTKKGRDLL